jgi:hypothetical protein
MSQTSRTAPDQEQAAAGIDSPLGPQLERPTQPAVPEVGGPKGPEPTRYGDWERGGRCIDF